MRVGRVLIVTLVSGLALLACKNPEGRQRYVISESKEYEASLFRQNCAICHGPEAEGKTLEGGVKTPNLRSGEFKYKTDAEIYRHISEGGNGMVSFRGQLSDREIRSLVKFVRDDLRGR